MGRPSTRKGKNLESRDFKRCCIALDFLSGHRITSSTLKDRYYGDLSEESFHKTFKRDRDDLIKEGLYLIEHKDGVSKSWSLDKEKTRADTSKFPELERHVVATLLRTMLDNPEIGNANLLGHSIAKIGQDGCGTLSVAPYDSTPELKDTLACINAGLQQHKPVQLMYQSSEDSKARLRVIQPWGMFTFRRVMYVVGLRTKEGTEPEVRTLRLDRAKKAKLLEDEPSFVIPQNFNVSDYRKLPFEIGNEPLTSFELYIDARSLNEFKTYAKSKGTFQDLSSGGALWTSTMCDTKAAALWAISVNATPTKPQKLVDTWMQINEEALNDEH